MAFQYAHHRPLTPVTPVHSPHPSMSSVRSRTPGQLSLHDYRKQQVTPSPPAIRGQRSVKKKRGVSSLNMIESVPAEPPSPTLFPSFQSLSTPPLTPSVGAQTPRTAPLSLPDDQDHRTTVNYTFPEFSHLQDSPPSSRSSSQHFLAPSLFQPSTPQFLSSFFPFTHSQSTSSSHHYERLPGENLREGKRRNTRYVTFASEVVYGSESESRRGKSAIEHTRAHEYRQARDEEPSDHPPGQFSSDLHQDLSGTLEARRLEADPARRYVSFARADSPRIEGETGEEREETVSEEVVESEGKQNSSSDSHPRVRHFKSIKRLPRPEASSAEKKPPSLNLHASVSSNLASSEGFKSSSTLSLSRFQFPDPPRVLKSTERADTTSFGQQDAEPTRASSTPAVLHYSGVFFDLVNPHDSLRLSDIQTPFETEGDSEYFGSPSSRLLDGNMSDNIHPKQQKRGLFDNFQSAYEGIRKIASSKSLELESAKEDTPTLMSRLGKRLSMSPKKEPGLHLADLKASRTQSPDLGLSHDGTALDLHGVGDEEILDQEYDGSQYAPSARNVEGIAGARLSHQPWGHRVGETDYPDVTSDPEEYDEQPSELSESHMSTVANIIQVYQDREPSQQMHEQAAANDSDSDSSFDLPLLDSRRPVRPMSFGPLTDSEDEDTENNKDDEGAGVAQIRRDDEGVEFNKDPSHRRGKSGFTEIMREIDEQIDSGGSTLPRTTVPADAQSIQEVIDQVAGLRPRPSQSRSPGAVPTMPLPLLPEGLSVVPLPIHQSNAGSSEVFSQLQSYGDTRNLLEMGSHEESRQHDVPWDWPLATSPSRNPLHLMNPSLPSDSLERPETPSQSLENFRATSPQSPRHAPRGFSGPGTVPYGSPIPKLWQQLSPGLGERPNRDSYITEDSVADLSDEEGQADNDIVAAMHDQDERNWETDDEEKQPRPSGEVNYEGIWYSTPPSIPGEPSYPISHFIQQDGSNSSTAPAIAATGPHYKDVEPFYGHHGVGDMYSRRHDQMAPPLASPNWFWDEQQRNYVQEDIQYRHAQEQSSIQPTDFEEEQYNRYFNTQMEQYNARTDARIAQYRLSQLSEYSNYGPGVTPSPPRVNPFRVSMSPPSSPVKKVYPLDQYGKVPWETTGMAFGCGESQPTTPRAVIVPNEELSPEPCDGSEEDFGQHNPFSRSYVPPTPPEPAFTSPRRERRAFRGSPDIEMQEIRGERSYVRSQRKLKPLNLVNRASGSTTWSHFCGPPRPHPTTSTDTPPLPALPPRIPRMEHPHTSLRRIQELRNPSHSLANDRRAQVMSRNWSMGLFLFFLFFPPANLAMGFDMLDELVCWGTRARVLGVDRVWKIRARVAACGEMAVILTAAVVILLLHYRWEVI